MIPYFTTAPDGAIRIAGTCQLELLGDTTYGEGTVHIGTPPVGCTHYIDGVFSSTEGVVDYRESRRLAYPPIQDLADALYWQSVGDSAKMREYLTAVAEVKARFSKI